MRRPVVLVFLTGALAPLGSAGAQTADAGDALAEIVVTAQKRAENVQTVPISVTAVSGEDLRKQGVVDILALANVAPGVQVSTGVLGPQINIRGVTSTNSTEVGDPAVAFHVDGVYDGRPRSASGTFYDVDRIEVLRGPQGTLYGRNATAGSVNVITNKPKSIFEASAEVETGNYGLISTTGVLNVPLAPWAAFRAAVQTYKHDGYTNNEPSPDANDDDIRSGRIHLLLTPADSLAVLFSGDIFRNTGVGIQLRPLPFNGDPFTFPIDNAAGNPHNDQKQNGGSVTVNWGLGAATVTYIGAYRNDELDSTGPSSTSPVPVNVALYQDQQSHELRVAGETSALKWLGGVFYYDEHQTVNVAIPQGADILGFIQNPVKSASKALFTQETYSLLPDLRLTGGLRYSKDTKSRTGGVFFDGVLVSPNIAADSWSAVNYRAAVDWDVTRSSLLYGSVTTGYKAGGYMDGVPPNAYGPEHLTAYEVGSKNRFLDNRLQLNLASYYYDYRDYQVSYTGLLFPDDPNGPIITRTTNAKKAVNYGAEGELLFALTNHDRVNANVSWLHATYENLQLQFVDLFGRSDYSGNRMVGAPDFSANLGYEHTWSLGGAGDLTARGQVQYIGNQDLDYRNFPLTRQGGFATTNTNLIYTSTDERWRVELWARNLGNKAYLVAAGPNTSPADPTTGTGVLGTPRTYGVRLSVRY
jgi:iron complex outermembrane receptor protein